jgi:transposase
MFRVYVTHQTKFFLSTEGKVNTEQVITAFDGFTSRYSIDYAVHNKPCIIVLDNASFHTSRAFTERIDEWAGRGCVLHYLPTYSPELNLIEILWRNIKYKWLPIACYSSYDDLKIPSLKSWWALGLNTRLILFNYFATLRTRSD